jgi:F420-0:gamma-glutamyl ligase-like protein
MLESVKKELKDRDFTVIARGVVERAIGEHLDGTPFEPVVLHKSKDAMSRGRLGGLKGGKARAKKLSAARRRKIAKTAAKARWKT